MPAKKNRSRSKNATSRPRPARRAAAHTESEPLAGQLEFYTVGIGASAGGLEALFAFLAAMPPAPGMAIVIVTHQQADRESLVPELLAKHSVLPVVPARSGLELQPDRVYVGPPGKNLGLARGVLELREFPPGAGVHLPIDYFFRELATDQEDRAIGIVLSGTGTDGTLGLRAVKGLGGLAIAQDSDSAQYPGMPISAAATLLVDCVLPPAKIPALLLRHARGRPRPEDTRAVALGTSSEAVHTVLTLLQRRSGHDFRGYKAVAVSGRIERRMQVHLIDEMADYIALLKAHPHELDLLFSELLINVTSFFRDEGAFRALGVLLSSRFAQRAPDMPFRAWVAGCSTGEEAYSVAVLLSELSERERTPAGVQVFGTDIEPNVIDHARLGLYPRGVAADIGGERIERFFAPEAGGYRIRKALRELCVFAVQSVIRDPPFTKLDLLSCRNLFIYLDADTQKRLVPLFHYALQPRGLLLLGTSETIGDFEHLFKVVDRQYKIYERLPNPAAAGALLGWRSPFAMSERAEHKSGVPAPPAGVALHSSRLLLERFAPPTLIVNRRGDIVYVHGHTGMYLELSAGEPQNNLLAMAREGLQAVLAAALRSASGEEGEITHSGVPIRSDGQHMTVDVIVQRLTEPAALRGLYRVSLVPVSADAPGRKASTGAKSRTGKAQAGRNGPLERELQHTRGALQGSIEELQSSNEELKSMNEELQSTNEELQSSNEELQTSKEELKSMNEELQTVNLELRSKMEELSKAHDDMANLLESTDIATLFLDRQLCIKRYTELVREIINLIPGDLGRPIGDLVTNLRYDRLDEDARGVLETLRPRELEVQTRQGLWRHVRIVPYRTSQNAIEGVAINFLDIDRVKRAEHLAASRALADSIVQSVREPLAVLDEALQIVTANPAFLELCEIEEVQAGQTSLWDVCAGLFAQPDVRAGLQRLLAEGFPVEVPIRMAQRARAPRTLLLHARRLLGPIAAAGHLLLVLNERSDA